ncbi:MAG: hypothetical protein ACOC44_19185, partial [Promethearchaeia archaeon]
EILSSLLADSLMDSFSVNILYQGIKGIGKRSLIVKVIKDLFMKWNEDFELSLLYINCSNKNIKEVLLGLLISINKNLSFEIKIDNFVDSKLSSLWTTIKLALRKQTNDALILFTNIDTINEKNFRKVLQYGKDVKIPILSTVNKVLRTSTLELLQDFDLKEKLNYFSYNQLVKILKQRVELVFPHPIDIELIQFLTDLIFEYHVPVPGKGIGILKELYPSLRKTKENNQSQVLKISKTQLDSIPSSDEINLFSYLSEWDILTLLFLDNLSNHFNYISSFYITLAELRELFVLSAESIEYSFKENEFQTTLTLLQNIGILSPSKSDTPSTKYFMIIDKNQLQYIIDACFPKSAI